MTDIKPICTPLSTCTPHLSKIEPLKRYKANRDWPYHAVCLQIFTERLFHKYGQKSGLVLFLCESMVLQEEVPGFVLQWGWWNEQRECFICDFTQRSLPEWADKRSCYTVLPWKLQAMQEKVQDRGYELSSVILSFTVDYSACVMEMVTRHLSKHNLVVKSCNIGYISHPLSIISI